MRIFFCMYIYYILFNICVYFVLLFILVEHVGISYLIPPWYMSLCYFHVNIFTINLLYF